MHTKKSHTVCIITLGCSKNIVDSEVLMNQIEANHIRLTDDPSKAGTLIINTCGFIEAAKQESINTILEASELKKNGKLKNLFVAGCLSERYRNELNGSIQYVDRYFGVTDYKKIIEELGGQYKRKLLGERHLSTPSHTAYLKISEGCDNPCSFCAIPIMRGKHVTKPVEEIIHEAKFLSRLGVKELVIIGQDTTYYGLDLYGKRNLANLLQQISDVDGIEWIRLMYSYPSHFPLDVLEIIRDNPKVCKYLDIPIQHISDEVLKSMQRGISKRATINLFDQIRDTVPDISLRTTLIVGYPNETEAAFEELLQFIEQTQFDRLGVFAYSMEEKTGAEFLGDPVSHEIKEQRLNMILEAQSTISLKKNLKKVGTILPTLLERIEGDFIIGRSEFDAPEVDNEVLIRKNGQAVGFGSIVPVKIIDAEEYDLIGYI